MDNRDKLLSIVKEKGPLLPAQINREIRVNVLFASAMLSEMVDAKKLRISSMKVGGSPLYYCEGQEPELEKFAHKMGEKEYRTFELLKKSKVMRDRDQDPQVRVSLREIKDFAIPLEVTANGSADLFWKFYLVPDDDAKSMIQDYINSKSAPKPTAPDSKEQPKPQESTPERPKEVQATISDVDTKEEQPPVQTNSPAQEVRPEAQLTAPSGSIEPEKPITSVRMQQLEESEVPEFSYETSVSFSTCIDTDEKVKIEKKPEPEPEPEAPEFPEDDEFFNKVRSFFDTSGIEIQNFELLRKGTEYDFIITLPSNVGTLNYYCKAKSKAKINEGDVSTAFVFGQMKKLPILFLTMGDLTKRAQELIDNEFKSMFVKKIE